MIYYFFIYSRHGQCREAFKLVKNIKESSPVGNPLHSNGNDLPGMADTDGDIADNRPVHPFHQTSGLDSGTSACGCNRADS